MKEFEMHLENCYGIRQLKHKFNFSESKAQLVYAKNGIMKSSLALTLEDIAETRPSKDRIFPERAPVRNVIVDGREISPDEIFVIQRMKNIEFKEASTILANEKLKKEYDSINLKLNDSKNGFLKIVQPLFGLKQNLIEKEISEVFNSDLLKFMVTNEERVNEIDLPLYSNIQYSDIFNDKSLIFLESKDFNIKIKTYIDIYEELLSENNILFMKGKFNHYNADTITKSLKDNNFFSANHKVKIKDKEIENSEELEELIKSEKEKVLSNPVLLTKFNEIDKALNNNVELRKFRSFLEVNQEIIGEFADLHKFRTNLILNYFSLYKSEFNVLIKLFKETSEQREKIIKEAKKEQKDWENVIKIFKRRFTVPFEVHIKNQEGVILNNEAASLLFTYSDGEGPENKRILGGPELHESLSTGEQRVFYLLNIIFQIETRKRLKKNQVVIVDDIADSFDYKNKYAIIEYLKDVLDEPQFFMIILTHNFDFYKTIKSRLGSRINYQGNWISIKTSNEIKLVPGERKDVFPLLRNNYGSCDVSFIACVPFVRNLIEFTIGDENQNYLILTSLLHMKPERLPEDIKSTESITVQEVLDIFNSTFGLAKTRPNSDEKVYDLIITKGEEIYSQSNDSPLDIKNKICISIAIRLIAEQFMISKIVDPAFHVSINKKQTGQIVEKYKMENTNKLENIGVLDRVNLMTAENIHINSFMYEPLMDLTDDHLKTLYFDVKKLS